MRPGIDGARVSQAGDRVQAGAAQRHDRVTGEHGGEQKMPDELRHQIVGSPGTIEVPFTLNNGAGLVNSPL